MDFIFIPTFWLIILNIIFVDTKTLFSFKQNKLRLPACALEKLNKENALAGSVGTFVPLSDLKCFRQLEKRERHNPASFNSNELEITSFTFRIQKFWEKSWSYLDFQREMTERDVHS